MSNSKQPTIITVGEVELSFNVGVENYNTYINDNDSKDKITPAHNLLSRTLDDECRDEFTKAVMKDGVPNGLVIMQMVGVLVEDFGGDVEISLKKPKVLPAV